MKRMLIVVLFSALTVCFCGCAKTENKTEAVADWDVYNERAATLVTAMAGGDFESAHALLDATMKKAMPLPSLQSDFWDAITGQAGDFISVDKIDNTTADKYFLCIVTSKHETTGVTLRVVFTADGLIAGLFIEGYPSNMAAEEAAPAEEMGRPIVIGEGTAYPLNGLLSVPDNVEGKVPAVVLVHGSGPNDRDETIFANKPFRDIADYLAANGIAVIRYDKRTFVHGEKMGTEYGGAVTVHEETVADALLAAEAVKSDGRIDADKVFIVGHSLGGMLAARIHAEGGNFAGIISLAGSPRSLLAITYDQQMDYVREMPDGEDKTAALTALEGYDEQVAALMALSDDDAKNTPVGGASAYYYKEMDAHPVSGYIDEITVPFLIMQGANDFQVYADKDFALWQTLLEGKPGATFKLYDGLNHLFMASQGKGVAEFQEEYKIAGHVDEKVLRDMAEWIKAKASPR